MAMREPVSRLLHTGGVLAGVGAIGGLSSMPQSAAQMFLWPWCAVYLAVVVLPWIALLGRALSVRRPLALPATGWVRVVSLACVSIVVVWGLSPFRDQTAIWIGVPLSGCAWFLLVVDFMDGATMRDRERLVMAMGGLGLALATVSLVMWASKLSFRWTVAEGQPETLPKGLVAFVAWCLSQRNDEPLGHVNYTAGLALLFLPWLIVLTMRRGGWERWGWAASVAICGLFGLSSGSRGGLLGVLAGAVLVAAILWFQWPRVRRWILVGSAAFVLLTAGLAVMHPGMRSRVLPRDAGQGPNLSDAERAGMISVAWRAGLDRPWTGWGVGSVPLVYDRYRGAVDYGAINMLQVHSVPFNLWMEGGLLWIGVACLTAGLAGREVWRLARSGRLIGDASAWAAAWSSAGYAVFGFTDYQLDLPVVALIVACNLGVVASAGWRLGGAVAGGSPSSVNSWSARVIILAVALWLAGAGLPWVRARQALAAGDLREAMVRAPEDAVLAVMQGLNAAAAARQSSDPTQRAAFEGEAVQALERALESGAHAEVCHFNLGWLLLERDPAAAAGHFGRVVRIAPSRRGTWLGFALSQAALGRDDLATQALAMEVLAQPAFLSSGWWTLPTLASQRQAVIDLVLGHLDEINAAEPEGRWPGPQARSFAAILRWLERGARLDPATFDGVTDDVRTSIVALADATHADSGHAGLLVAAIRGERRAKEVLGGRLMRMGVDANAVDLRAMLGPLAGTTGDASLRRLLSPRAEDPLPIVMDYPVRSGFGVRQRNPYAGALRDAMVDRRNVLAECFADWILPKPGWIFDQRLLQVAGGSLEIALSEVSNE